MKCINRPGGADKTLVRGARMHFTTSVCIMQSVNKQSAANCGATNNPAHFIFICGGEKSHVPPLAISHCCYSCDQKGPLSGSRSAALLHPRARAWPTPMTSPPLAPPRRLEDFNVGTRPHTAPLLKHRFNHSHSALTTSSEWQLRR